MKALAFRLKKIEQIFEKVIDIRTIVRYNSNIERTFCASLMYGEGFHYRRRTDDPGGRNGYEKQIEEDDP